MFWVGKVVRLRCQHPWSLCLIKTSLYMCQTSFSRYPVLSPATFSLSIPIFDVKLSFWTFSIELRNDKKLNACPMITLNKFFKCVFFFPHTHTVKPRFTMPPFKHLPGASIYRASILSPENKLYV